MNSDLLSSTEFILYFWAGGLLFFVDLLGLSHSCAFSIIWCWFFMKQRWGAAENTSESPGDILVNMYLLSSCFPALSSLAQV